MKNFNLGGLHEKVFDLSSYLKDGERFAGLLQSYNNFAGNLWLLVVLSALFSSIIVMKKRNKAKLSVWLREVSGAKTVPKNHANINKTGKSNENMRISAIESIGNI